MGLQCQLCWENIEKLTVSERQRHYDNHLEGRSSPQSGSSASRRSDSWFSKGKSKMMFVNREKEQDVFWHPAMQTPPPTNFIPGLIPVLKKALLKSHAKGTTTRAVLCYERAVYISRQMWDASWGCGYRNFLMSCAALMDQPYQPLYFPLLDQPVSPGIRNLQTWIEEAWKNGFDVEGRAQLQKLVNTNKWIGTSDICVAFLSRGIPAELVDFEVTDLKKGLTPLTNWIVRYFNKYSQRNSGSTINAALLGASPVQCARCMPLIVQDNKHSRMVIGYELTRTGAVSLLVFDPSRLPSKRLRSLALSEFSSTSSKTSPGPFQGERRENEGASSSAPIDTTNQRMKMVHVDENENVSDTAWNDEVEEIQFIEKRERDDIEFIGVGRKGNASKVDKDIPLDEPSYSDVLKHFRWENRSLQKRHKYQILYFPLEEPLTKSEMRKRKILTSERIS
ncbi:peptidase family C78-domain-containing protein [Lentinula detonsa]|uniref:Peptidase family C78-domain-containing protein n=1 Tax=Lentinula detonsa TaxID=2804962 RepID=A0AA38PYM1_9AGAR|nr:peptidase family C78-domain-containing protein [Lentinula detonsa]